MASTAKGVAEPTPCLRLTDRLRGIYTIPVNDGLGPLNGKDTFTPAEPFFTPPIQKEAADRIERLEEAIKVALGFHQATHIHAALREALK